MSATKFEEISLFVLKFLSNVKTTRNTFLSNCVVFSEWMNFKFWKISSKRINVFQFIVASGTSCQKTSVCIQWADATKTTQFSLRKPMQSGDLAGSGPADRPTSPWQPTSPWLPTSPARRPPSGPGCCTGYNRTYLCQYLCCLKVSWP